MKFDLQQIVFHNFRNIDKYLECLPLAESSKSLLTKLLQIWQMIFWISFICSYFSNSEYFMKQVSTSILYSEISKFNKLTFESKIWIIF